MPIRHFSLESGKNRVSMLKAARIFVKAITTGIFAKGGNRGKWVWNLVFLAG